MTAPIFMTNDLIVKYASAAGATEPVEKVSSRYCVFRPKTAIIPMGKRPLFRREFGHHSGRKKATIPEQSGQCKIRE